MRAIHVRETGGPEALVAYDAPEPTVGEGDLLVDVIAAGVNFIDLNYRSGAYPAQLPFAPGGEGVGVVRVVGPGATGFATGDRVAWTGGEASYAQVAIAPAATTVKLPDNLPDEAGFVIAQGLTAHYLAIDIVPTGPGMTALVHAAAGGVGSLLTRILKIRGARVIATVSGADKADMARRAGADEVLVLSEGPFAQRVRGLTGGKGVEVAFDGVGRDTFAESLASVRVRGTLALYGASSGPVDPVNPTALSRAGSISLIRPALNHYIETREVFQARVDDLFGWLADGRLEVSIGGRFPLEQAAEAHRALESRKSTGKLILVT